MHRRVRTHGLAADASDSSDDYALELDDKGGDLRVAQPAVDAGAPGGVADAGAGDGVAVAGAVGDSRHQ